MARQPSRNWPKCKHALRPLSRYSIRLSSDETARTVALGWHDDKRMADDYKLVDEYLQMEKPYDVKTAYTNEFLDKAVKMPPIHPPKLY